MAGIIKVDRVQSDSNLAFNIAGANVAFMDASALRLVGSSIVANGTTIVSGSKVVNSAMPVGSVLQVVQAQKTDTFSTSSQTFVDVTGLSVSITPSSTSSKILVFMDVMIGGAAHHDLKIVRNSTDIAVGDTAGSRIRGTGHFYRGFTGGQYDIIPTSMTWLDSPSTTSALTYKIQIANPYSGAYTTYVNKTANDTDADYNGRTASSITVMEIAG